MRVVQPQSHPRASGPWARALHHPLACRPRQLAGGVYAARLERPVLCARDRHRLELPHHLAGVTAEIWHSALPPARTEWASSRLAASRPTASAAHHGYITAVSRPFLVLYHGRISSASRAHLHPLRKTRPNASYRQNSFCAVLFEGVLL